MNDLIHVISHKFDKEIIPQRIFDGYLNATKMCQAVNKLFADYQRLKSTKEYLQALGADMGIPISELVQSVRGGDSLLQGTWVHPQVAIHLGQWLSPQFAVLVNKWFYEWVSGKINSKQTIPYHIRRYIANRSEIPHTHFSMLNELVFGLIAPLEGAGYTLPEKLMPDVSQGKMFSNWLRQEKGLEPKDFPSYTHRFEDGREVQARLYPNQLLPDFREHFHNVWIPSRAEPYFSEKDPAALPYLKETLLLASSNEVNENDKFDSALNKAIPVEGVTTNVHNN